MIRHAGRLFGTMFLASVPALGALAFGGPADADDSQAKPRCVGLLTADELLKAGRGRRPRHRRPLRPLFLTRG